jgi:PmbA protein
MKLKEAAEYLFSEAQKKGLTEFDIIGEISESIGAEIFEKKISNTDMSYRTGIGIRIFRDGKPGISFTEKFSKEAIFQTLNDAISNSKLTDSIGIELPGVHDTEIIDFQTYNSDLDQVNFDDLVNLGLELEKYGLSIDSRIENVPYVGASKSYSEGILQNSKGLLYERKFNSVSAWVGVTAKNSDSKKMGFYSNSYRSFQEFSADFMAKIAVERATELLGAESIPSGKYPVVFSNRISSSIIGMFLSPYYAEVVQKGQSRLAEKLEKKIASDCLTITCNPLLVGMPGSRQFDSEGVPTYKKKIIENGVLKTFLYNLESAKKGGVKSTGNGSRSYSGKAGTGVTNLLVDKGNQSLEKLLKVYPECLYITKLEGASGCSALSGDISIGAQGFLYKNGERVKPIDKITLSTNYFDLIQKIIALSNEYLDSYSSFKVPDILVEEIYVAG